MKKISTTYYQNIYKTKKGEVVISERVWSSIDDVVKAILTAEAKGNEYVSTVYLDTKKIVK